MLHISRSLLGKRSPGDSPGLSPEAAGNTTIRMPLELIDPDLAISLQLDAYAPRAARYHVAHVDRPSPDLRDAVVLLTSELVTRAAQQCQSGSGQSVELRVWMPADVVRIELRAPYELLTRPLEPNVAQYDLLLLDQVADRWSIESAGDPACMWFEIDRHAPVTQPEPELSKPRQTSRRRRPLSRRPRSPSRQTRKV
jgi:hypothetical protein